ncbi:hypothetical protein [Ectothiorhodospira lacustris]|uniref:hypothetical protein n=1 Tax=Ectothiorhodospira lacustris TaxID=2899127 RepID=UPI001EE96556|nr:hypothetical protein [Ectothiorhodospira lacustris]MCG5508801.1 hypothetical protein [Ectothiorhodospira lacustris]MCG5520592.1 hypothetical protein [Ectothiorhodospira lacustris]
MSSEDLWGLWADNLGVSILIWMIIGILLLYLSRPWLRPALRQAFRLLEWQFRAAAHGLRFAGRKVRHRHQSYLRGVALQRLHLRVDRECRGIHHRLNRDLGGYAILQRRIAEQIERLEEDYRQTRDQVPEEPVWIRTAQALGEAPAKTDPRVNTVLQEIHDTLARAGRDTLDEYRHGNRERLKILRGLLPEWRALGDRLSDLEKGVVAVRDQARHLDVTLSQYQRLKDRSMPPPALTLASVGQLAVSLLLLGLLLLTGFMNFNLLLMPVTEILGWYPPEGDGFGLSALATLLFLLMPVVVGAMILESRGVTSLLPMVASWDAAGRRRLMWGGILLLGLLVWLSGSLAASRELFIVHEDALGRLLEGEPDLVPVSLEWLSLLTLLSLGGLMTLLLALTALPLQLFMQAMGVLVGWWAVVVLQLLAFLSFHLARMMRLLSRFLPRLYDLILFLPLRLEHRVRRWQRSRASTKA